MKNLPNGMYQYGNSVIHRMDITVKLVLFLILAAAVSAAHSPVGYAVMIVFVLFVLLLSRIGFRQAIGGIPALLWFFIVIFIMNLLFFDANHAWIRLWIFSPYTLGNESGGAGYSVCTVFKYSEFNNTACRAYRCNRKFSFAAFGI